MPSLGTRPRRRGAAGGLTALTVVVAALALISTSAARPAPRHTLLQMVDGLQAAHPNALWHIVHGLCVRDMRLSGHPAPCADVNLAGGYAVLKDVERRTQYLLVPTARISGIESPELLGLASPNYWQAAWSARRLIERQLGQPIARGDIGLAINAVRGRTQNQLHIHIDCVLAEVRQTLSDHNAEIGPQWSDLSAPLAGGSYRARWITGADLGVNDPFKLLAADDPAARADMAAETLVLIGATRPNGEPGFVLLSDRVDPSTGDIGAGEHLLDHHCKILSLSAPN